MYGPGERWGDRCVGRGVANQPTFNTAICHIVDFLFPAKVSKLLLWGVLLNVLVNNLSRAFCAPRYITLITCKRIIRVSIRVL